MKQVRLAASPSLLQKARRLARVVAVHWSSPTPHGFTRIRWPEPGRMGYFPRAQTHDTFCISGMAFQDAWTLDLERLRDCYIHTASPDRRLVPFCAYNLTDRQGRSLYRTKVKLTPLDPWISRKISAGQSQLTRQELEAGSYGS